MKYCKDCKWYENHGPGFESMCDHPSSRSKHESEVEGPYETRHSCRWMRGLDFPPTEEAPCYNAKLWEPAKPEPPTPAKP